MRQYPNIVLKKDLAGKPTWWKVVEDVYCDDVDIPYVIPRGFVSNFASIPRLFYPIVPPHGPSAIPSVKHDYRYINLVGIQYWGHKQARLNADRQYLRDLKDAGVNASVAKLMYLAIRLFGVFWWNKHISRRLLELTKDQHGTTFCG